MFETEFQYGVNMLNNIGFKCKSMSDIQECQFVMGHVACCVRKILDGLKYLYKLENITDVAKLDNFIAHISLITRALDKCVLFVENGEYKQSLYLVQDTVDIVLAEYNLLNYSRSRGFYLYYDGLYGGYLSPWSQIGYSGDITNALWIPCVVVKATADVAKLVPLSCMQGNSGNSCMNIATTESNMNGSSGCLYKDFLDWCLSNKLLLGGAIFRMSMLDKIFNRKNKETQVIAHSYMNFIRCPFVCMSIDHSVMECCNCVETGSNCIKLVPHFNNSKFHVYDKGTVVFVRGFDNHNVIHYSGVVDISDEDVCWVVELKQVTNTVVRETYRVPCKLDGSIKVLADYLGVFEYACTVLDISFGGALIEMADRSVELKNGDSLDLQFRVYSTSADVSYHCTVVRQADFEGRRRYGLSFVLEDKKQQEQLTRILFDMQRYNMRYRYIDVGGD